jgi:hypothetical protein
MQKEFPILLNQSSFEIKENFQGNAFLLATYGI